MRRTACVVRSAGVPSAAVGPRRVTEALTDGSGRSECSLQLNLLALLLLNDHACHAWCLGGHETAKRRREDTTRAAHGAHRMVVQRSTLGWAPIGRTLSMISPEPLGDGSPGLAYLHTSLWGPPWHRSRSYYASAPRHGFARVSFIAKRTSTRVHARCVCRERRRKAAHAWEASGHGSRKCTFGDNLRPRRSKCVQ